MVKGFFDANGSVIGSATADINGAYQFDNIPDGNYSLSVDRVKYATQHPSENISDNINTCNRD